MAHGITERNVIAESLEEQILTELRVIRADLNALRAAWDEYAPVVAAFRRGGVLAARTAARRNRSVAQECPGCHDHYVNLAEHLPRCPSPSGAIV